MGRIPRTQHETEETIMRDTILYIARPYFNDVLTIGKGTRVELTPSCDLWMRGAKYGTVTRITGIDADAIIHVRMDHPQVRRIQRLTPDQIMGVR